MSEGTGRGLSSKGNTACHCQGENRQDQSASLHDNVPPPFHEVRSGAVSNPARDARDVRPSVRVVNPGSRRGTELSQSNFQPGSAFPGLSSVGSGGAGAPAASEDFGGGDDWVN